jgi:histidinol-phosphate aminotransferase
VTPRIRWAELDEPTRTALLRRPATSLGPATREAVLPLLAAVRAEGDAALRSLTARLDGVTLERLELDVTERDAAFAAVGRERRAALERAVTNLTRFHELQGARPFVVETQPGVRCERLTVPIDRVGLYAPGGTAPLCSTVLMLGVPAMLAGSPTRILCSPPRRDGTLDPHLVVAAALTGITRVFKLGGAQAIAAMAYGTASVPKVDKIFGPGNAWVTQAKVLVAEDPDGAAIDLPAGPSEVLVIADDSADPTFVAADLLSQAEHGADSQVVLVATSAAIIDAVERELEAQLAALPRRELARASLAHSRLVEVGSTQEALEVSNRYAPEHLILQTRDARALVARVRNAGSVFVGPWSPESVGDYASGTNHVLPTYGWARSVSGLSLEAFQKTITVQELSVPGLRALGPVVETLAELEGLDAHRRAVSLRLERARGLVTTEAVPDAGLTSLARPTVRALKAYQSARSSVAHAPILLDANESPWTPLAEHPQLNRYPSPQPSELRARLADLYGVPGERLVIGRGTDDVIDWLLRGFCEARMDGVVTCPPTYGVYSVYAELQGARVTAVPLGPAPTFALDVRAVLAAVQPTDKLVFVCSPNNPTGGLVPEEDVLALCAALRGRALVVLDEAYAEFASRPGLVRSAGEVENLVVLRTLSKAFGLAGARCGVGVAHPEVTALLHKVRPPYPLPGPAVEVVLAALGDEGQARSRERVAAVVRERARLGAALSRVGRVREVYPSEANFLLARVDDSTAVVRACRDAGIIVRDRSTEAGLAGCVRITVGTPEEDDRLLAVLARS